MQIISKPPRIDRKRHQLLDSVAIADAIGHLRPDSWVYIELFGKSKLEFSALLQWVLPHGQQPSHDTFGDVYRGCPAGPGRSSSSASPPGPQAVSDLILPGKLGPSTARRSADCPHSQFYPAGHPPGQRLGLGQHADVGHSLKPRRSPTKSPPSRSLHTADPGSPSAPCRLPDPESPGRSPGWQPRRR